MKNQKKYLVVLAILLAISLLASCAGNTGTPSVSEAPSSEAPAQQSSETPAGATGDTPVTISVGGWGWLDTWVPIFQRELSKTHPNITIAFERMEYADYINKLRVNLSAGTAWDLIQLQSGSLLDTASEFILPLDSFAEQTWGADWKNEFMAGIPEMGLIDGKLMGVPDTVSYAGMLLFNKTRMDSLGLSIPKNYEELKNVADTARSAGSLPVVIGAQDAWISIDIFTVISNDLAPGKLIRANDGEIPWDDPDIIRAFAAWKGLFDDGIFQDGALGVPHYMTAYELFWNNRQGMAITEGDWALGDLNNPDYSNDEYVLTAFPDMNGDGEPCPAVYTAGILYGINKNLDETKVEACWNFIDWMVAKEGIRVVNTPEGGAMTTPAFKSQLLAREGDSPIFEKCYAELMEIGKRAGSPRELSDADIKTVLGEVLQELGVGLSPEAAAAKLNAVHN